MDKKNPALHPQDNTVVISANIGFIGHKLRNFYITNGLQGFTWMLFHFSIVYFFMILLDNIILVGLFLGFANLVSFLVDIPIGILQKYISTKRFFIFGAMAQLIAVGIFLTIFWKIFITLGNGITAITSNTLKDVTDWFFGSMITWVGLIVAAICYGITKEMNEVTTFGYILSNADPNDYGIILSRSNITFGIGSVIGLVFSGLLLDLRSTITLLILGTIIMLFLVFTIIYFDNSLDSISLDKIKNFKISIQKFNQENVKEPIIEEVEKSTLNKVIDSAKYLFLRPKQHVSTVKIPWGSLISMTKQELQTIWQILSHAPIHYGLLWGMYLVLIFGFWDTFASSFLIDFMDSLLPGYSYVLLAIIGVPGVLLQEVAIRVSKKIGAKTVGNIGMVLSFISLIGMGILVTFPPGDMKLFFFIGLAIVNSLGYACGMAIGQESFLDFYNRAYAAQKNLKEIDANVSSGPIKIVQNLANVIGLMLGGFLLSGGFAFFFFVFALIIILLFFWTIKRNKEIHI